MTRPTSPRACDVLLVEDDPEDELLLRGAFQQCSVGHRLHCVPDGEQALAYLRRRPPYADATAPDLILLDLNLPRLDGRETLAAIRGDPTLRLIPVVVVTTSSSPQDVERAYALHANGYVVKPMDLELLTALARAIEQFWFTFVRFPAPARSPGAEV